MTQNITLHEKIKGQIIEAMRAKDAMTLETLRGLTSLFSYELISKKSSEQFIDDESALTLIKRSVKQIIPKKYVAFRDVSHGRLVFEVLNQNKTLPTTNNVPPTIKLFFC